MYPCVSPEEIKFLFLFFLLHGHTFETLINVFHKKKNSRRFCDDVDERFFYVSISSIIGREKNHTIIIHRELNHKSRVITHRRRLLNNAWYDDDDEEEEEDDAGGKDFFDGRGGGGGGGRKRRRDDRARGRKQG